MASLSIRRDDLRGPEIARFLDEHLADMYSISPPENVHALDLEALRQPGITFWSAWDDGELVGCGALKRIDDGHVEIKSMRTAAHVRGKGVASSVLAHLLGEAARMGYTRVSLETGTEPFFAPARALYEKFGFESCGPFADYVEDTHSAFYTRTVERPRPE